MNILVSACLLGVACRYDGNAKPCESVRELMKTHTLIPVCPESLGGLPIPRLPVECRGKLVVNRSGCDVTDAFLRGARQTLLLAELYGCKAALLKERSPSCGHGEIYDGSFSGRVIPGDGVTAALLLRHGIEVYGESEWEKLLDQRD